MIRKIACFMAMVASGSTGDHNAAENPLPPCPDTPNCYRTTLTSSLSTRDVFAKVKQLVLDDGAKITEENEETGYLHAVYTIFLFRDDITFQIAPSETGSRIHVRSASRVGHGDLGVNERRVKHIKKRLP